MKDTEVKKRGWVKNAAIIFLAVMLVLTFFSNTIMNRSLPEVAAQYTTSGSITARIRGTGTVRANEQFDVKAKQTRTVTEVSVREGDEVNVGDVLIRLSGAESEELEGAKADLRDKERELEDWLINSNLVDNTVAEAARNVQRARNALSDAQSRLAGVQYNEAAYNTALAANNQAQAAFASATATATARQYDLDIAQAELDALGPSPADGGTVDPGIYAAAEQKVRNAAFANDVAQAAATAAGATAAATEKELANQNRAEWISENAAVREAQLNLNAANDDLTLAQSQSNVDSSMGSAELRDLRRNVEEAKEKIEELEKESEGTEITSLVAGIVTNVNIGFGEDTDPSPEAPPLMVIEVVDRGYSLNFQVTSEQASKVSIGDHADVDRGWWGEEIRATLIGIRNDPMNPAASRILHFSISGDVESGTQLNLILAQKTENYSIIVPNSAIRTDTNGDFVLVVMSRSSPLGNRYIATRVDVNVIATDDTNSAVAGALSGWDFVITTATAPIDPGMQVRLVDNP